ncbi:LLM class F420-dependent oxidoreductase [Reticulibacter mediterranei]|uniref:LLM class F420-dependent oxidoreductase n=1 Tax=Reticulibacter mediterranei TaxID=2778369 RepID=A0A8J3IU08_9CHLR|nr:LLM class flavin-dependent oxidoreductase [Reticulibacter mediterranei]GHO96870.1 LLM class F420-dependent oxidoreductase [Reticulibacter mediterranei]
MERKRDIRSLRERVGMLVELDSPKTLVDAIVEIEQAGVEQIWVGAPPWKLEMLTALTAAAMRTSHIKLGTSVLQIFARHPVLLAQQALSLEALAPGRLRLGIGTSAPELGKSIYGVEIERPLAYLREYVQVLRSLLQSGEVHHQGRYFTTDVSLEASAEIPLLIAALGPRAYHLAGEIADGAISARCPIPYLLDTALPAMREGATAAGRPRPPIMANVSVAFTQDRAIAFEIGRKRFGMASRVPFYRNMYLRAGFSPQEIDTASDRFIENLLIFGDEGKIRESFLNLLGTELDELRVTVLTVSDPARERTRLTKIIGNLGDQTSAGVPRA